MTPLETAKQFLELNSKIGDFLVMGTMEHITYQASKMPHDQLESLLVFLCGREEAELVDDSPGYELMGTPNTAHYWLQTPRIQVHLGFKFDGKVDDCMAFCFEIIHKHLSRP